MAADEALLDEVAAGAPPALRLYRWSPPALSLGRFQPDDDVDADACARLGVEVVRRPTGGRGLLHGGDLTYAVAMPRPAGPEGGVDAVYRTPGRRVDRRARPARGRRPRWPATTARAGPVCFAGQQGADLRVGDRKLCGSAQVRRAGAVLQHGSVLLERLPFDETDLLAVRPGAPVVTSERLRAATVTLGELGAPSRGARGGSSTGRGFRASPRPRPDGESRVDRTSRVTFTPASRAGYPSAMRCRQCGHQNESGANFCSSCGQPAAARGRSDAEPHRARRAARARRGARRGPGRAARGHGHARRAPRPERRQPLRARRRGHRPRPPPRLRHLPRRHHGVAPPRRRSGASTAATRCATSGRSTAPTSTTSGSTPRRCTTATSCRSAGSCSCSCVGSGDS